MKEQFNVVMSLSFERVPDNKGFRSEDNPAPVRDSGAKTLIPVMRGFDEADPIGPQIERMRAARDAERTPHFGLIDAIDPNRVVRGSSPFKAAHRPVIVGRRAGVDKDAPPPAREFKRQRVGMAMARLIIGAKLRRIEDECNRAVIEAPVAAVAQFCCKPPARPSGVHKIPANHEWMRLPARRR